MHCESGNAGKKHLLITILGLAKRVAVVEQILSDAIPLQPGEPGYDSGDLA
jgi:hypothetical protein